MTTEKTYRPFWVCSNLRGDQTLKNANRNRHQNKGSLQSLPNGFLLKAELLVQMYGGMVFVEDIRKRQ